jgi:hypothetical protein
MDKKLLDSLNNLSLALTEISDALKSKSEASSATAKALKGGDFIKEIKEINVGVKQLQKDTKQILANQQTIMKMGKQKKQESAAEKLGGDKKSQNNFKEGLKVILLIAVAVLAIGVAFKLIGSVNFLAVIALSIALPLLAIGFAKVHKTLKEAGFDPKIDAKNFIIAVTSISLGITMSSWILGMVTPLSFAKFFTVTFIGLMFALLAPSIYTFVMAFKDMTWSQLIKAVVGFPLILPAIALGISFASWALQLIKPIGFMQFLTAVGIGIVFAIISFGIEKMVKAFRRVGIQDMTKAAIFLPLILPAIALGIALSSYALQLVKPVGFVQFLTALGISLIFTVIAFGLEKMMRAFKKLTPVEMAIAAASVPVLLVAISGAIAASSWILSKTKPISFTQFLTALGIAAVFTVLSFGIAKIVNGVRRMDWKSVAKIPVFFVLVAIAITASSHILALAKPLPLALIAKLVVYGVALAIVVAAVGGAMFVLKKLNINIKDALMGSLLIVVMSVAIMISSHILALGNYKNYPSWKWALGVGLSIIAFAPGVVVLGLLAMADGGLSQLLGALMVVIIATAIMVTSHILALGNYKKYPPILWTLGVVAAMVPFAIMAVALGAIALTGIGLVAFAIGLPMVLTVAATIVETSHILAKGKYDNKGMLGWAIATTMLYAAFTPILLILGAVGMAAAVADFFGPNPWDMAREMMVQIAQTIVDVAGVLSKGKFVGGPTKEWAEGVGIAIGAFAPVYKMLVDNAVMSIFGGGGIGPKEFTEAILITSLGIITAAQYFAANKSAFKNGPSKAWSEGVGTAIGAFAPVFKFLEDFPFSGGQKMAAAIKHVAKGIINAAEIFAMNKSQFDEGNYPSKKWGEGVGAALGAFAPVFKQMHEDSGWFTSGEDVVNSMKYGIMAIAWSLVDAAYAFSTVGEAWSSYPSKEWAGGVSNSVTGFMDIFKTIEERGYDLLTFKMYSGVLTGAIASIALTAKILYTNSKFFTVKLDKNFIKNIASNVLGYAMLSKTLEAMLTSEEKKTINLGVFGDFSITKKKTTDVSNVNKVVNQMVFTAGILYRNKKFFEQKIDPNFMKGISSNVLEFARLAKKLAQEQKGMSVMDEVFGTDPISRAAKGMVKIAGAYDALAKSIRNFGGALNSLNVVKLSLFRSLTGNLALMSAMDSTMFSNMLKVLEQRSGVFAQLLKDEAKNNMGRPTVTIPKPGAAVGAAVGSAGKGGPNKDSKGETSLQKLDKIIFLLSSINKEVVNLDEFIVLASNNINKNTEIGKADG